MLFSMSHKILKRGRRIQSKIYSKFGYAKNISAYNNIYHCCTQKTASQWFRNVFQDPIIYKYTGLDVIRFSQMVDRLQDAHFDEPFPNKTLVAHLYIDYETYLNIPKIGAHKTFFVLRDPRDIVVSWYFSVRYSHRAIGRILEYRAELERLNLRQGLKYSIDRIKEEGLFDAQKSWIDNHTDQMNVQIYRYEDFAADNFAFLKQLLSYLEIPLPDTELTSLYKQNKFEIYSSGRELGKEKKASHYRKGISGDWKNYFDDSVMKHFKQETTNLVEILGYEE